MRLPDVFGGGRTPEQPNGSDPVVNWTYALVGTVFAGLVIIFAFVGILRQSRIDPQIEIQAVPLVAPQRRNMEELRQARREAMQAAQRAERQEREVQLSPETTGEHDSEEVEPKTEEQLKEEEDQRHFDLWRKSIKIEEAGTAAEDESPSNTSLAEFLQDLKHHKIVVIEELAARFHMPTTQAVQRLNSLREQGTIRGVTDDKGKFILLTDDDIEQIRQVVLQHGQVNMKTLRRSVEQILRVQR